MAKAMYIGTELDSVAHKVIAPYVGDENGIARRVVRGFIGDENGIARLFYEYLKYVWEKWSVVTTYKWDKYNAESKTTYREVSTGSGTKTISETTRYSTSTNPYINENGNWAGFGGSATIHNCIGEWIRIGSHIYLISSYNSNTNTATYSQSKTINSVTSYYKGDTSYGTVTSTSSNTYPSGQRHTDGYWYVSAGSTQSAGTYIEDVKSSYADLYPNAGVSDGYWYIKKS